MVAARCWGKRTFKKKSGGAKPANSGHLYEKVIVSVDKDTHSANVERRNASYFVCFACLAHGMAKKMLLVGNDFVSQSKQL